MLDAVYLDSRSADEKRLWSVRPAATGVKRPRVAGGAREDGKGDKVRADMYMYKSDATMFKEQQ